MWSTAQRVLLHLLVVPLPLTQSTYPSMLTASTAIFYAEHEQELVRPDGSSSSRSVQYPHVCGSLRYEDSVLVAGSRNPQYPSFDSCDLSFVRRQHRLEEAAQ